MKMADVRAKFVSQKISKIRWKPPLKQALKDVDTFATGSWDDEQADVASMDESGMLGMIQKDPELICEAPHVGDVTGLEVLFNSSLILNSVVG
ncbi:hypothetical protein KUTeg_007965 [Tegillarca granosa]|uniref:Uncharacterized protein n=1 Tax=Tegillarca granosa TaxID=220873 RepID=A0ABQ9FET6_TEGGR|nr:hypothetical protein KUTeg_007965 [Tegillarca granosa]